MIIQSSPGVLHTDLESMRPMISKMMRTNIVHERAKVTENINNTPL